MVTYDNTHHALQTERVHASNPICSVTRTPVNQQHVAVLVQNTHMFVLFGRPVLTYEWCHINFTWIFQQRPYAKTESEWIESGIIYKPNSGITQQSWILIRAPHGLVPTWPGPLYPHTLENRLQLFNGHLVVDHFKLTFHTPTQRMKGQIDLRKVVHEFQDLLTLLNRLGLQSIAR